MISVKEVLPQCGLFIFLMLFCVSSEAQTANHLMVGVGALYERGLDATVAFEHETENSNAWEYFANGYLQYKKDPEAGHITKQSFWHNYHTWSVGIAYKPCVVRGRNHHGNVRIGASGGSDSDHFVGGVHVGYEHTYYIQHGWALFWQVKEDVMFRADDHFRTGVALGVKIPM